MDLTPNTHTERAFAILCYNTRHPIPGCLVNALQADENMEDARRERKLTSPEPVIVA